MSLEDAKQMSKIEEGTVEKLKETVLGTFFDNRLISDLIVPLFPLRNNDTVTNFILKTSTERAGAVAKRFGKGQDGTRNFITQFKNAIPNYILQNYMSNFVDENGKLTSMPKNFNKMDVVSKVGVKNGAEIINGKLFVDEAKLRKEYQEGLYYRNNTMPGNYSESGLRGLGALVIFESEAAYFRYVFERENQRNLYSLESVLKNKDFKKMRELTANDKEAYEAYINQRALINAFNRASIMGIEGQSYTDMVLDMIEEFNHLKGRYPILSQFTMPNIKTGERVLTLNDKAMLKDPQLAEIYFENLKDLADENVKKVTDPTDNKRISKLFGLLPIMSMYQHGIGYSKYGFNEALPYEDFIRVMETASEIFMKSQLNNDTLGNIFELMLDSPNRDFTNFVRDPKTYISPKPVIQPVEEEVIMDADTPMVEDMLAMAQSAEEQPTQPKVESTNLSGPETKINIYAGTKENAELSNFAERPFMLSLDDLMEGNIETTRGDTFASVEQAFQVMKYHYLNWNTNAPVNSKEQQDAIDAVIPEIEKTTDGSTIKRLGKKVNLSKEQIAAWDKVSSKYMKDFITQSFKQNPDALAKLLATGNATLTHKYNGVEQDDGRFSKVLMEVRDELRGTQPTIASANEQNIIAEGSIVYSNYGLYNGKFEVVKLGTVTLTKKGRNTDRVYKRDAITLKPLQGDDTRPFRVLGNLKDGEFVGTENSVGQSYSTATTVQFNLFTPTQTLSQISKQGGSNRPDVNLREKYFKN